MLVPSTRAGRSPTTDFTVLVSLTGGLLVWLVLASYGLGRAQKQAGVRLQQEAALAITALVSEGGAGSGVQAARDPQAALARLPALRRLADSTGLRLVVDAPGRPAVMTTATLTRGRMTVDGRELGFRVDQASDSPGMPMAPGMPQAMQAFVVAALAGTCLLGSLLLYRLQREHETNTQRSDFVRVVSHELRTPLAQILMFAETLRLGRTRSEADRSFAIGAIVQETRRLSRLVENVLRFTRLEHGGVQLRQEAVNVSALVRETAAQFTPIADGAGVMIRVATAPDDVMVLGDRDALQQVLLNLLDNAVKYGPGDEPIEAHVLHDGAQVQLAVEDAGPGLSTVDQERIWRAFERGNATRADDGGTGLGLTIVRALTEAMGGGVRYEPRHADGRGARFVVMLRPLGGEAA